MWCRARHPLEAGGCLTEASKFFDASIERALLGTLLRGGDFGEVAYLSIDDFGTESHRQIWVSIARVVPEVRLGFDAVTHDLIERGKLDSIGGLTALMDLHADGIPGVGLAGFAKTLREKTKFRRAVRLAEKLRCDLDLHGLSGDPRELSEAARELLELTESAAGSGCGTIHDPTDIPAVGATQERIAYIREELPEGSVVALTGDSESGKSTLATAWARDAVLDGRSVFYLDRENPRATVLDRMARLNLSDCPQLTWWGNWCKEDAPDPGSPLLARWVQNCERPPVVIVDSLSAFHGGDENDATLMRKFMNGPRRLASLGARRHSAAPHRQGAGCGLSREFRLQGVNRPGFVVVNVGESRLLDRLRLRPFKSRYGRTEEVIYRYAGGRLFRDERVDASVQTQAEQLTELLREIPGIKRGDFVDRAAAAGITRQRARDFLDDGVEAGTVALEPGPSNAKFYSLRGGFSK